MPELLEAPSMESFVREYVELRARLEMLFRKWFPSLRGQESDFYNDAWESLLHAGAEPDCLSVWLERALYTRGLNELRRRERRPGDQAGYDESVRIERVFDRTEEGTEEHVIEGIGAVTTQQLLLDELSPRQARIWVAERDVHAGTLRAWRLPEQPPEMRRSLHGRRGAKLVPEQIPSLVPTPFMR